MSAELLTWADLTPREWAVVALVVIIVLVLLACLPGTAEIEP